MITVAHFHGSTNYSAVLLWMEIKTGRIMNGLFFSEERWQTIA